MSEEYNACSAQLIHPPVALGKPWDEWIKSRPVASRAAVAAWLKEKQADSADGKKKRASGALPANTEWL